MSNGQRSPAPLSGTPQAATFSDPIVTSTVVNQNTNFSLRWTDPSLIKGYIFSFDSGSGGFINDSFVPENSTAVWTNATKTIYGTEGERIQWLFYVLDGNGLWTKSYTYSFVAGLIPSAVSLANFRLITDNSYDLLAYDGTNLANLANFPQFVGTQGPDAGFHLVKWNPQGTLAIAVGYNNSAVLYSRSSDSVKILSTGASKDTNLEGIAWTPNGTSAIITGNSPDTILAYSSRWNNFTQITNPTGVTGLGAVAWNPTSDYAIVTGSDGLIKISSAGALSSIPQASGISFNKISFNPNGTMALLGTTEGGIYKFTTASSELSLINTTSSIPAMAQIAFSRDGGYALISSLTGDIYKFDGSSVYPITSESRNTSGGISFAPDDSYAQVTTEGGLLTESYDSNVASFDTLTTNTTLTGIAFLPPAITPAKTNTSVTNSSLGSISIQTTGGPYSVGRSIGVSGHTIAPNGTVAPNQTIYLWVNGQNEGSVTSNASGYWASSFTPTSNGTNYLLASQGKDGGGVTSEQLAISVAAGGSSSTTTKTTTSTTQTTTQTVTSSSASVSTNTSGSGSTVSQTTTSSSTVTSSSSSLSSSNSTAAETNSSTTTSSTFSYSQSTTTSHTTNLVALFGTVPYVTTDSPTALGTVIFFCEVGLVIGVPIIVWKLKKKDNGGEPTNDWRW